MSDTQDDTQDDTQVDVKPGADIPNFSVVEKGGIVLPGGGSQPTYDVTFGTRTLSITEMTLPEQWNLLEIAPAGGEAGAWFDIATIAASVRGVDGHHISYMAAKGDPMRMRNAISTTLAKLGRDGLRAAGAGLAHLRQNQNVPTQDSKLAQAGN